MWDEGQARSSRDVDKLMLMKRRTPPTWYEYLRILLWPRRSWLRSGQYVTKRILRITATPHAVAAGVAAGAFTSFTPFMGVHFIIAALLAWLIRGNIIASALGTFVGNPLTFPFIWAATYQTGHFLLNSSPSTADTPPLADAMANVFRALWHVDMAAAGAAFSNIWFPLLYPMTVGGILVGLLVSVPIYFATRRGALIFRESRRNKLMKKASELRDRARQLAENRRLQKEGGVKSTP